MPPQATLTVRAGIEVRRVLHLVADHKYDVQFSPDHKRYLMILTRADVVRDGNWIEFVSGELDTLGRARATILARLFTRSKRVSPLLDRSVTWLHDGERIAFLWDSGAAPTCIMTLNLRTGALEAIAKHTTDITNFSLSRNLQTIIYSAESTHLNDVSKVMVRDGFAVMDQTALWDLLNGKVAGSPIYHPEVFVRKSGITSKILLPDTGVDFGLVYAQTSLNISPDGSYAVVSAPPQFIPRAWLRYDDPPLTAKIAAMKGAPSEPSDFVQYWLVDITRNTARPLWDAPNFYFFDQDGITWSPDSRRVIVGPTFLPLENRVSAIAREGHAFAVFEPQSGAYTELRLPNGVGWRKGSARWIGNDAVEIQANWNNAVCWIRFVRVDKARWLVNRCRTDDSATRVGRVDVQLQQSLNKPPQLVVIDNLTGRSRLLYDVDPGLLLTTRLGAVSVFHWKSRDGRPWSGKFYAPVGYDGHRRCPILLKFGYFDRTDTFSVSGDDDNMDAGGAQALAGRGIATLLMNAPDGGMPRDTLGTPREFELSNAGYEGAIDTFARRGLIDSRRVGVAGVSRGGDRVVHFITSTTYPIAAALMADNLDDSYLQYLSVNAESRAGFARDLGAEPFGRGLFTWLRNAPGFNTDHIHTPVRLEKDSGGLSASVEPWEIFSQLRYAGKPVELYFVPDIEHGDHQLSDPVQLLASQGGAVDWFDFWLNGHEDPDPKKKDQYRRWEKMCDLQAKENPLRPVFCVRSIHK